jgi:CheY-like chemotaxis protein
MGNLDLARRAKDDRRPRLIENAIQAVEQGRKLTAQLLAFGRGQVLQVEFVDIPHLMASTHQMLAQSLRGDIAIEIDLAEDLWPVRVDPSQLQVALINLAANARDAMPNGGQFSVTAENVVLRDGRLGEAVAIAASDTGIGIPRDVLSRIFEPFFTTKEVGKGSGLGLAQVYSFAQQSGGSVDVRSEDGRGTTVTLYLPKAPVNADRPAPPQSRNVQADAPRRRLSVLLVEDNAGVAEVGRTLLVERGHRVRVCGSADEGLQALDQEQFDVVCSDLVMPGAQNGLDLARILRQRLPHVSIILMTGYSEAAGTAIEDGFTLLRKPYDPAELIAIVENAPDGTASGNVVPLLRESHNRPDK